jgi:multimeric flavodoxin WrbA
MRVLLLRGNPRKSGYTQRLADWFVQGLNEVQAQVDDVDVAEKKSIVGSESSPSPKNFLKSSVPGECQFS